MVGKRSPTAASGQQTEDGAHLYPAGQSAEDIHFISPPVTSIFGAAPSAHFECGFAVRAKRKFSKFSISAMSGRGSVGAEMLTSLILGCIYIGRFDL